MRRRGDGQPHIMRVGMIQRGNERWKDIIRQRNEHEVRNRNVVVDLWDALLLFSATPRVSSCDSSAAALIISFRCFPAHRCVLPRVVVCCCFVDDEASRVSAVSTCLREGKTQCFLACGRKTRML